MVLSQGERGRVGMQCHLWKGGILQMLLKATAIIKGKEKQQLSPGWAPGAGFTCERVFFWSDFLDTANLCKSTHLGGPA